MLKNKNLVRPNTIKNKVKPQGLTPEEMSDISQDGTHVHKLRSTEKNAWPSNFN